MSKRLATVFFVVIGSIIFLIAGFCLMLFLAPGFSVFGLKYIRPDVHLVSTGGKIKINDTKAFAGDDFKGNIIVNAREIPINIIYSEDHEYFVEYYDNYAGFTTSKFDDPTLSISKDSDGNCVISVQEFKKFIYESSSSVRYLNVYVPLQFVGENYKYVLDLTVNTSSSTITFTKEIAEDARIPAHDKLEINTTSGKLKFKDTNVKATVYKCVTNNTIKLYGDENKEIWATEYDLESKLGRIVINGNVPNNIKAKTKNGNIEIVSCKNLVAETSFGDVVSASKDQPIEIRGIVNISTKAGSVVLGKVNGNGENKISTGGGSVSIDTIKTATITTKRGSIKIRSVTDVVINTNVGKVSIEEVLTSVDIKTKRGNVELGGNGMTVNNPTVSSNIGKINLKSASGKVVLKTSASDINFTNANSEDIDISCGKELVADKLTGKVKIHSEGAAKLVFTKITKRTEITLGDKCKNITVQAEENTVVDTNYYFAGKYVVRYEDQAEVTRGTVISPDKTIHTDAYISIEGKNADIRVYFKKPN